MSSLPATADVVVVGGGIVGATTAAAVAARGASVMLLEKEDRVAHEGSGRAQGSLRIQGRHGGEFALAQEALARWTEAAQDGDFELVTGGNLYFQTQEDERPVLEHLVQEAHEAGLSEIQLLNPREVRDIIPAATGPFLGAMWSPIDAHCQPEKGTRYYADKATRAGAQIAFGVKATNIRQSHGRIVGVDTTAGTIHTSAVVVAAGVWTPYLTNTVGVRVPIMPVVMSELETQPVQPLFEQTIRAFGFGSRQRPNGRVVISAGLNAKVGHGISLSDFNGLKFWAPRAMAFRKALKLHLDIKRIGQQVRHLSTLSPDLIPQNSPEPRIDKPLVHSALAKLQNVMPGLSGAKVARYWAGLVDMTPDGLPVIDGHAGPQGLTIITGLCGHGFTLGPVLGEIASDLSLDGTTTRPIEEFRLSRYTEGNVAKPEMMI